MPSMSSARVNAGSGNIVFKGASNGGSTISSNSASNTTNTTLSLITPPTGVALFDSLTQSTQTSNNITLGLRNLVAGNNITITTTNGFITIGATMPSTSVSSGEFNVRDYGAAADGSDQTNAFNAAVTAAIAAGGGMVVVPAGNYVITSQVTDNPNVSWLIRQGAVINDSSLLPPISDQTTTLGNTTLQLGRTSNLGTIPAHGYTSNEFVQVIQHHIEVSNSSASYEKIGLYLVTQNYDPSDYGSNITRDAVGVDSHAYAQSTDSRVWCYAGTYSVQSTGFAIGMELTGENDSGVDTDAIDTATSTYGIKLNLSGQNDITAAIILESVWPGHTGSFNYGIYFRQSVLKSYAWVVGTGGGDATISASVDPAGNLVAKTVKSSGGVSAFGATPPSSKPTITGSRGGATASVLQQLLSAMSAAGFITDSTTA